LNAKASKNNQCPYDRLNTQTFIIGEKISIMI
jgi:hypothetical protein